MNTLKKTFFGFALLLPTLVFAQEGAPAPVSEEAPVAPENLIPPAPEAGNATGNFACMDYFAPGAFQVDIASSASTINPGAEITLTGKAKNTTDYLLTGGVVQIRIFRVDNESFARGDGDVLVDQFVYADNFALGSKSEKDISTTWLVPEGSAPGQYYATTTLTAGGSFPLVASPFSDQVVGTRAEFSVSSTGFPLSAFLDKGSVTVNDQDYRFAEVAPRLSKGEAITVKAKLVNPTGESKAIRLTWKEYAGTPFKQENQRNQKIEVVELAPNESKDISYTTIANQETLSYISAEVNDRKAKSILNISFERGTEATSQLVLAGLTKFPLKAGEQNEVFACARAKNTDRAKGGILTMSLWDQGGNNLYTARTAADAPENIGGWKIFFTPEKDVSELTMRTVLELNGAVLEETVMTYGCEVLDTCKTDESGGSGSGSGFKWWTVGVVGILVVLGIIIAIVIASRRRGRPQF